MNLYTIEEINELIDEGKNLNEVIKYLSTKYSDKEVNIRSFLHRHKIKIKSSHKLICNDTYFDGIDCEEKAYLLGFFLADGSIYKEPIETRHSYIFKVGLAEKDLEIIEYFKKYVCPNSKIRTSKYKKGAKNRMDVKHIAWTSRQMNRVFCDIYGIKPRKTYDIFYEFPFQLIEPSLIRHFIRGYFDGDGCVTRCNEGIKIEFYATSLPFLKQMAEIIKNDIGICNTFTFVKKSTMILHNFYFHMNSTMKRKDYVKIIYDYLYENSNIYLKRKKAKFDEYLNTVLN